MSKAKSENERIINDHNFQTLCKYLIPLTKDENEKKVLESILYQGSYNNYSVYGGIGKNNPEIEILKRASIAYLFLEHPETFYKIAENNITYFHGTNNNALPGILKNGLNSYEKSSKQGTEVKTGEKSTRTKETRDFISFIDILDVARFYSENEINESDMTFPIIFGTTKEEILKTHYTANVRSDYPEIAINDNLPVESIKCIMVPDDKVEIVKKMTNKNILILAIDKPEEQFYQINTGEPIIIMQEKYNRFKERKINREHQELQGIKESVSNTKISAVKRILQKLNNYTKGVEERSETKRTR